MIVPLSLVLLWAFAAALGAWYVATCAREIRYATLSDGRKAERSIPLVYRTLLPFVENVRPLLSKASCARTAADAQEKLVSAGFEGVLSGEEFVALKVLMAILAVPLALLAGVLSSAILSWRVGVLLAALILLFALCQPDLWLRRVVKARHLSIQRALPFVLDLLTLSVEAGMDFMSALQRHVSARRLDALGEELLRMTKEVQIGLSRQEALRNMAARVRQSDLKALSFALIQADELGVSIGSVLRIQSSQLRARRFDRAEKLAAEAPVKMLGPLMLCIFPAVFIILMAPVLFQAMEGFFSP